MSAANQETETLQIKWMRQMTCAAKLPTQDKPQRREGQMQFQTHKTNSWW